jgi:hypothetical protein
MREEIAVHGTLAQTVERSPEKGKAEGSITSGATRHAVLVTGTACFTRPSSAADYSFLAAAPGVWRGDWAVSRDCQRPVPSP